MHAPQRSSATSSESSGLNFLHPVTTSKDFHFLFICQATSITPVPEKKRAFILIYKGAFDRKSNKSPRQTQLNDNDNPHVVSWQRCTSEMQKHKLKIPDGAAIISSSYTTVQLEVVLSARQNSHFQLVHELFHPHRLHTPTCHNAYERYVHPKAPSCMCPPDCTSPSQYCPKQGDVKTSVHSQGPQRRQRRAALH